MLGVVAIILLVLIIVLSGTLFYMAFSGFHKY